MATTDIVLDDSFDTDLDASEEQSGPNPLAIGAAIAAVAVAGWYGLSYFFGGSTEETNELAEMIDVLNACDTPVAV